MAELFAKDKDTVIKVPWQFLPGTSQDFAFHVEANHILYTGTRGPGKTECQLMRFFRRVGQGYGPYWRGVLFDREYKNLDDAVAKTKRLFPQFKNVGGRFLSSKADYKWIFNDGSEFLFRVIDSADDYWDYHGQEFPFIGWNELTKWPSGELYDLMMSVNRSSYLPAKDGFYGDPSKPPPPPIPLEVFSTTNSSGPGHGWVKRKFILPAEYGELVKNTAMVYDPLLQKEREITKTQIAIFGSYKENPFLSPEYILELQSIKDPNIREAWFKGSWNVTTGGALDDVFDHNWHVLPKFKIPSSWRVDRAMDWGSSTPYCIIWFAEANGEEATLDDGRIFCPPAGTLIAISELYGAKEFGTNKGLKHSSTTVADLVNTREKMLVTNGSIQLIPFPGPADNQISDVRESDVDTIEAKMSSRGVQWRRSDKSPGSRRNGLQLIRDRLEASKLWDGPGLYFMQTCPITIETLATIPRDKDKLDDVDTSAEDHAYDCVRYRVLASSHRYHESFAVSFLS